MEKKKAIRWIGNLWFLCGIVFGQVIAEDKFWYWVVGLLILVITGECVQRAIVEAAGLDENSLVCKVTYGDK